MSMLAVLPLVFQLGVDGERWREVLACQAPIDEAFLGAMGMAIGAWAGAIPIPLGRFCHFYEGGHADYW